MNVLKTAAGVVMFAMFLYGMMLLLYVFQPR